MTREEALEHAKREQEAYHRKAQDRPFYKDAAEFWDIATEALEKQEKYRRHDLRKNPEDLPKMGEVVLIELSLGEHTWKYPVITARRGTHIHVERRWDWMDSYNYIVHEEVIAWRYIEPFEEDNE